MVFAVAWSVAGGARAVTVVPGPTASERAQLLACDSADVMLQVATSNDSHTSGDGTIHSTGTSEVLAYGRNGREWVRRFADALLPEGREWKARTAPAEALDREDGRDPWTVHIHAYANGKAQSFWVVNLLDGWAGRGLGPAIVFDLLGSPDTLRAVLASGMTAYPDAAKRLRKIREPDATIMPLPDRMRR
ncbi:MAG: hypothetical protein KAY61_02140 [Candidatus Eisenbacteria bacterium]|nr:hypothetical protein [Candidatus Eisenbacteria bacterium]